MKNKIYNNLIDLMMLPGLSGHEKKVCNYISQRLKELGLNPKTDVMGNLWVSFPGEGPSVMLFTHMDQIGFVVRKIEENGFIKIERLGGVPEKSLASQAVIFPLENGNEIFGVITNKSHHATQQNEKYSVVPYKDLYIDVGVNSFEEVLNLGINIGSPVVYKPSAEEFGKERIAGTSIDDRAGCAIAIEIAEKLSLRKLGPPIHLVFSVQEEFNLRGVIPIAQQLLPDIAIQLDLILATDTSDMEDRGNVSLGKGPAISLYSFHGRGTLNGIIPHPALVKLFEETANQNSIPLQKSVHIGALTDLSYVQLVGKGVASIDVGFPIRYSHSSLEVCDLNDLILLTTLLEEVIKKIDKNFSLER